MPDPVIIELESADAVVAAAEHLRANGYSVLEAYTPFPIPELDEAIGTRRTKLPWLVLCAGASGAALAYLVLWWTSAVDYRLDVGGRPYNSLPTHVPIVFETMVLFAAGTAFLASLLLSGLPRLHHPVFELEGFERTSIDRFWITIGPLTGRGEVPPDELALLRKELAPYGPLVVRGGER
jgi:hypothetical protein